MVSAKEVLRSKSLKTRAELGADLRAKAAAAASQHFLEHIVLEPARTIAAYWPMGAELDCRGLIKSLRARGHRICLPVVVGRDLPLIFREWDGESALHASAFGTHVPGPEAPEITPDVIILPLAGFDKKGNRLGYGKGFYDRTIAAMVNKPRRIGLAFSCQEVAEIPASSHDVPLQMIVTENGIVDVEKDFQRQESDTH